MKSQTLFKVLTAVFLSYLSVFPFFVASPSVKLNNVLLSFLIIFILIYYVQKPLLKLYSKILAFFKPVSLSLDKYFTEIISRTVYPSFALAGGLSLIVLIISSLLVYIYNSNFEATVDYWNYITPINEVGPIILIISSSVLILILQLRYLSKYKPQNKLTNLFFCCLSLMAYWMIIATVITFINLPFAFL